MKIISKVIITAAMLCLSTIAQSQSAATSETDLHQISELAEQGDAHAQNLLGEMYYFGKGVPRDVKVGIRWLAKSAAQGNASSQFYLGTVFYNGQHLPKNYEKAFKLFALAAAQGMRNAKTNLGVMYHGGEGVPKDLQKAFEIFSATAELGDKTAQLYLAGMYFYGEGIPIDYVQAYKWATIADQIDLKNMKGNYAVATESHSMPIQQKMTSEQRAEAKELISDWLKKHPEAPDSYFR